MFSHGPRLVWCCYWYSGIGAPFARTSVPFVGVRFNRRQPAQQSPLRWRIALTLFFSFFFYFLSQLSQTVVVVVNSLLQVDRGPFPYWLGLLLLLLLSFKVLDSLACVCKSGFHSLSLNFSVFSLPLGARAEEEQY